jgi:hypothetical protein
MRVQKTAASGVPESLQGWRPGCWYKPKGAGIWLRVYATRQELDSWIQDWWDWLEFNSGLPHDAVRQASEELLRLRREMR